ncbi:hypothetical protein [Tsuneonella sp. HG222]
MAISLKTAGSWARVVTDPSSVTIPGSPAAGDRMFLFATWKTYSITVADPSGWTPIGTPFTDGAVAGSSSIGSVKVMAWYRDWQPGDANPSLDWSAAPTEAHAVIMLWQKGAGETWGTPTTVTAAMTNWTTSSQTVSASSTTDVPSGSVVMGLIGIRDDSATMTRPTTGIDAAAGITWSGNYVESPATHFSSSVGNDMSGDLGHRFVTTGAAGATLRMTGTISASETGAAKWVVQALAPTVALNTPADAGAVSDTTPDLTFTGTDPASAALRYKVEVGVTSGFASENAHQTQSTNNTFQEVYGGTAGSGESLQARGQAFTPSETLYVTKISLKLSKQGTPTDNILVKITSSLGGTVLATSSGVGGGTLNGSAIDYEFTFSTPPILQSGVKYFMEVTRSGARDAANSYRWHSSNTDHFASNDQYFRSNNSWSFNSAADCCYILYTSPVLLSKVSGTDAGFSGSPDNSDPFASAQAVTYTVQSALPDGTYYWRVAAIEPTLGAGYGPWSSTRSFTLSAGASPLDATVAAFTLTGTATGLTRQLRLTADLRTYALTRIAAVLAKLYRLTADVRTYSLTGVAADFRRALRMPATTATFSLSGTATGTYYNRRLTADQASFTLTGVNATIARTTVMAAAVSSFALTGVAATFRRSLQMPATVSNFTLSGVATPTTKQSRFNADPAAFVLTGYATAFPRANVMLASTGVFTLTGTATALNRARSMPATVASFTLTGIAAQTGYNRRLAVTVASFSVTTVSATFSRALRLVAALATYSLTGIATPTVKTFAVQANLSAFNLTGIAATIARTSVMPAGIGNFTLTGNAAEFANLGVLEADRQTYELAGIAVQLLRARRMAAETANFALSGVSVSLPRTLAVLAQTSAYSLAGTVTRFPITMPAAVGTFTLTGNAAAIQASGSLPIDTASFTITAQAATLTKSYRLDTAPATFAYTGNAADIAKANILFALQASFTLTGRAAGITKASRLTADPALYTGADASAGLTVSRRCVPSTVLFDLLGIDIGLIYASPFSVEKGELVLTLNPASFGISYPPVEDPFSPSGSPFSRANSLFSAGVSPFNRSARPFTPRNPIGTRPPSG